MGKTIKLRKGHDIKLKGKAERKLISSTVKTYAARPGDFLHKRFKVLVEVGDEVKAGTPLAFDKKNPDLKITAPVSGEIAEIKRGDKRKLEEIVVLGDAQNSFLDFGAVQPSTLGREGIVKRLQESGAWYLIRQRPFDIVASPRMLPRDVFISGFDSAPLAPDYDFALEGNKEAFQAGVDALNEVTDGQVYLGSQTDGPTGFYNELNNVQRYSVKGKHPAGNVGIQLHHVKPIRKGETVWHVRPEDVVIIGRLFTEGHYNTAKRIAICGQQVDQAAYVDTHLGANVTDLVGDKLKAGDNRIISGNVLTGRKVIEGEHLGTYHNQVCVIPEGRDLELLGWLIPSYPRPDISSSFLSSYMPNKEYSVNTNTHGERRAFVVSGQYEKVLPMEIFPVQLLKSILYEDFDEMEAHGLLEVGPEDFALCEFVCTSKIPVQQIIQQGLDLIYEDE